MYIYNSRSKNWKCDDDNDDDDDDNHDGNAFQIRETVQVINSIAKWLALANLN